MPTNIKHCTNCGSDQIVVAGNRFLCRICNIVYEVTDTGTKVLDTNPLAKHEQTLRDIQRDIAELKKEQGGDESNVQSEPSSESIDDEDEAEDVDETEEDGFIVFE